jgi:hypothetical protein
MIMLFRCLPSRPSIPYVNGELSFMHATPKLALSDIRLFRSRTVFESRRRKGKKRR